MVQRVQIFVPGQEEIPKESHLLRKKFEFLNIRWRANIQSGLTHKSVVKTGKVA